MIQLPDFDKSFEYENAFHLSCDVTRISKFIAHYELYRLSIGVPGAIVECGVFKGISFIRLMTFRDLLEHPTSRRIVGFDTFTGYPETDFDDEKAMRNEFIGKAGDESISEKQLVRVLEHKGINENVELVPGLIEETVPEYIASHPEFSISLLHLDTDLYAPSVTVMKHLFPRISRGGILILDDYTIWPGETQAVNEYLQEMDVSIRKFSYTERPCYVVKQ